MEVKDFYTATEASSGDVFVAVLTVHVQEDGTVKTYRCPWPCQDISHGIPQGDAIFPSRNALNQIFPVLKLVKSAIGVEASTLGWRPGAFKQTFIYLDRRWNIMGFHRNEDGDIERCSYYCEEDMSQLEVFND